MISRGSALATLVNVLHGGADEVRIASTIFRSCDRRCGPWRWRAPCAPLQGRIHPAGSAMGQAWYNAVRGRKIVSMPVQPAAVRAKLI